MKLTRRGFLKLSGAAALALAVPEAFAARPSAIPVLRYGDLSNRGDVPFSLRASDFAAQMEWLFGEGYRPVFLSELGAPTGEDASRDVIITFDGGYASFMDFAYPLLREYGFKAVVNVAGGLMGGYRYGNDPRLSWDECRFLLGTGLVDIGCQGDGDHGRQRTLVASGNFLKRTIVAFSEQFSSETGRMPEVLAVGVKRIDDSVLTIARQAGFRFILSEEPGLYAPRGNGVIPRVSIDPKTSLSEFRKFLSK